MSYVALQMLHAAATGEFCVRGFQSSSTGSVSAFSNLRTVLDANELVMDRRPELRRKLRGIYQGRCTRTLVIAVPGVGLPRPEQWSRGSGEIWLQNLPNDALPDPAIFAFDHGLDADASWPDVFDQSSELLEALLLLKEDDELRSTAMVFVAHSIGGLIVKKHYSQLHPFTNAIAAVVLMGTPHSRSETDRLWPHAQMLLKINGRYRKKPIVPVQHARTLAELSTQFEEVAVDLPILSLAETIATTLKGLLFHTVRVKLTGDGFAKTGSRLEQYLEIAEDHVNMCKISHEGRNFLKTTEFFRTTIEKAHERIQKRIEEYNRPPVLDEPTLASIPSTAPPSPRADSVKPGITNQATYGTVPYNETSTQVPEFTVVHRDPCLPCHIVPLSRNRDFCGRRDVLDAIEECLLPQTATSAAGDRSGEDLLTFALTGPGGMGKTQVAVQFCLAHLDDYDAIFWIHADHRVVLDSDFSRIAIELGLVLPASRDAKDLDVTRELVKGWLAKPVRSYKRLENGSDEASWLLVFDNVTDSAHLTDFWPSVGSSGSVLITSRDPLAKTDRYNTAHGKQLGPLGLQDAISLLLKLTWRENETHERDHAAAVAHRLGCYPLALTQMASVMVRQDLAFQEFVSRYDEEEAHRDLFSLSFDNRQRPEAYVHTLASVWALDDLKSSPTLLNILSMLDPDEISDCVLEASIGRIHLPGYPSSYTDYYTARSELLNCSLISRDRGLRKIVIHRLIQDAARARLTTDQFVIIFSAATEIILNAWPSAGFAVRQNIARWKECEELLPHAVQLKVRFEKASSTAKDMLTKDVRFADLLNELGWYFQERARVDDALNCFEAAQHNLKSYLKGTPQGSAPEATSRARFLLAETYRNIGSNAAEINKAVLARESFCVYNEMMLKEFDDVPIGDDSRLPISFLELATAHIMLRDWEEAFRCNHTALKEIRNLADPAVAINLRTLSLTNLACACLLTGRVDEALFHAATALREREGLYGVNDRQSMITGRILHALGNIYAATGSFDESFQYHQRALIHFKDTVGDHHHRTADMCCKVAAHLARQGRLNESLALIDQGISIYRNQAYYRGEISRAYFIKSTAQSFLNHKQEAKDALDFAVDLYRQVNPGDLRSATELDEHDFENVVHFWSR